MYICLNCGEILENTVSIHEYHNELDDCPIEEYYGCPYCKSSDVVETRPCDICGEYIKDDYVELKDGSWICGDCFVFKTLYVDNFGLR